jgi:cytochrome c oxidase subunit 2
MNSNMPLFPEQASTFAGQVDNLYFFLVGLTVFFTVLVAALSVFFAVRYRRRQANEVPEEIHGSAILETLWIAVPFVLAMVLFVWGTSVFFTIYRTPVNAMEIYVVAKQWMWKFQHPDGQREINELHVPVGRKVKLVMTTEDVIHSFYVPAFRFKADAVPGRYTYAWFEATKPGRYHLFCAEYCGTSHSSMGGWVVALEPQDYQAWLSGSGGGASLASLGQKLFQNLACASCHLSDGQGRGPALEGIFGKTAQLEGGQSVPVEEAYLRESILNPRAKIVERYQPIMPTFQGLVSEEQLLQLVEYIKSIGPKAGTAIGAAPAGKEKSGKQAGFFK